jgi:hypothetical protein
LPHNAHSDLGKHLLDEFSHRMRLTSRQDVIIWFRLLQKSPRALDIISRMSPIALGVKVAEKKRLLSTELNCRDGTANFPRDESLSPVGPSWLNKIPLAATTLVELGLGRVGVGSFYVSSR